MFKINWKKEILTIPNLLSLFRIGLIPVYMVIYLHATEASHYYLSAAILAVSCLTDLIDGKIARHFNMISTVGKILDPFADKATQFTLILCLALKHPVLWFLVGLFVVKEGFQAIAGAITLKKGKMLDGALFSGKVCTTILFISLILLVMLPTLPEIAISAIAIIDAMFMINAFMQYYLAYFGRNNKLHDIEQNT